MRTEQPADERAQTMTALNGLTKHISAQKLAPNGRVPLSPGGSTAQRTAGRTGRRDHGPPKEEYGMSIADNRCQQCGDKADHSVPDVGWFCPKGHPMGRPANGVSATASSIPSRPTGRRSGVDTDEPRSRIPANIGKPSRASEVAPQAPPIKARSLAEVVRTFQAWLYLPDPSIVYVVLAAVAANLAPGDPLWVLIVGASSSGKTEVLMAVAGLPHVYLAATMTESALLSGSPQRERAKGAKGGLLREIGDFGIILAKDFTSILSINRDTRSALLAALREVYDGAWDRHVGADGGRTLSWRGKVGFIGGCTAAWDAHHAVVATMGERFLIFRPPDVDPHKQATKALANSGKEAQMRRELADAVRGLFAGLTIPDAPPELSEAEVNRLVALGSLVARCRSAVERDGRTREIELILDAEAPARITQALRRLYGGLLMIGLDRAMAWAVVTKTGLDCMPRIRRAIFDALVRSEDWRETSAVATAVGYPTNTARRALEDLGVHSIAERTGGGQGKSDMWRLSPWARTQYQGAGVPEMLGGTQANRADADEDNGPS